MEKIIFLLNSFVFVYALSLISSSSSQTQFNMSSFSLKCGIITEIPGDPRTLVPWNAAIFMIRRDSPEPVFVNSGVLISSSTVLAVFGSFYGAQLGKNKRYSIPHSDNFIIGVGLKSTNFNSADAFSQFSQVNYVLPHSGHDEGNKEFHFWLYHLKTPFNLETPFAKIPCLPFFFRLLPTSWQLMHGGFTHPTSSRKISHVKAEKAVAISETGCNQVVKRHYGGNSSSHVWCSTFLPRKSEHDSNVCLLHGSAIVAHLLQRWFIVGITALIPDKKYGDCSESTKYIHARTQNHNSWLQYNVQCGPNQFACVNATCIPLHKVCNRIADCPDDDRSDEDPIFCQAQNRCRKGRDQIECHMKGKCLNMNQLCDNIQDCEGGSDENKEHCQLSLSTLGATVNEDKSHYKVPTIKRSEQSSEKIQNYEQNAKLIEAGLSWKCSPISISEGTKITCLEPTKNQSVSCTDNIVENTIAILSCDKYYSARFRIPTITMTCKSNGMWLPFRSFACDPNCGVITSDVKGLITYAQESNRKNLFPWYAAIFREKQNGNYNFICGGSLIENRVVLTAAHCVEEVAKLSTLSSKYKVILAPVSSHYEDNLQDNLTEIFEVKQVRVPPSYNFRSLVSDIAIVELLESVKYGKHIRPICYLQTYSPKIAVGQFGKVAGFGYDENGQLSETLKYTNFPVVSRNTCAKSSRTNLPSSTFCAGYNNGTSLCNGDSGGGIVFLDTGTDYERYTLKGVVSAEASWGTQKRVCQTGSYSIFTYVDLFREWILKTLERIDV